MGLVEDIPRKTQVHIIPEWGHQEHVSDVISLTREPHREWRVDGLIEGDDSICSDLQEEV